MAKAKAEAEDFPEDKYDFKAASSTGTFAERMILAPQRTIFFVNLALTQKPPSEEDHRRLIRIAKERK